MQLQVLKYKRQEDTEQLYSDTRTLLENYNPGKVTQYNASDNVYSIAVVREGDALSGKKYYKYFWNYFCNLLGSLT